MLPEPSGQPSLSASSLLTAYFKLRTVKSYISSRNLLSPVHRHTRATALGNFTVSSVLKSLTPLVCESWPYQIDPSETDSCTTTPDRLFRLSELSRSSRSCYSLVWNCSAEMA